MFHDLLAILPLLAFLLLQVFLLFLAFLLLLTFFLPLLKSADVDILFVPSLTILFSGTLLT